MCLSYRFVDLQSYLPKLKKSLLVEKVKIIYGLVH
jgi:hypothetical protein